MKHRRSPIFPKIGVTNSILTCARHSITLAPDDPYLRYCLHYLFSYLHLNQEIKKSVLRFSPAIDEIASQDKLSIILESPLEKPVISSPLMRLLMETATYFILFCDTRSSLSERLAFIEKTAQLNVDNEHLREAYQKIIAVFSGAFSEKFTISARDTRDPLVPVITYLPRIHNRARLNAHLSFLSVTRSDYHHAVFLPHRISPKDEIQYMKVFFDFIKIYSKIERWQGPLFYSLLETSYAVIKNSPRDNIVFLKERFERICGSQSDHSRYWKTFENASYFRLLSEYISASLGITELKEVCDFCLLLVTLTLWYGQGDFMQKTIKRTIQMFQKKYKSDELLTQTAIFLLPIDFAFIHSEQTKNKNRDEYGAILRKLKTINPQTEVQPLNGSRAWIRDSFAWLDDNYQLFLQQNHQNPAVTHDKGGLYEGGSIIAATGQGKFNLVSQEVIGGELAIAKLTLEAKKRGIEVYALPGGFSWTRNTDTFQDTILDSMHIDTVINVVPDTCTTDRRIKIIVDPYYYEMIKDDEEFKRLQKEQGVFGDDLVIIDKNEAYLNLANFSVILGPNGSRKILFNKDKGLTLPRLNIKKENLIQPDIEIVNISAFNGNIRCITNMCPRSQIKKGSSLLITVAHSVPKQTEAAIMILFINKKTLLNALSKAWVSSLQVRYHFKGSSYEFDDLSQTISINLGREKIYNPRETCIFIEQCIKQACEQIRKKMGILFDKNEPDDFVRTLATTVDVPETGFFMRRRTGQLVKLHDSAFLAL